MQKIKNAVISALSGQIAAFLVILITGYFATKAYDPEKWIPVFSYSAICVGAIVCGLLSHKMSEEKIVQSLVSGIFLAGISAALSLIPAGEKKNVAEVLIALLLQTVIPLFIALLFSKSQKGSSRRKARKKAGKMYKRRG